MGDFDEDGRPDVAAPARDGSGVAVHRGDGRGGLTAGPVTETAGQARAGWRRRASTATTTWTSPSSRRGQHVRAARRRPRALPRRRAGAGWRRRRRRRPCRATSTGTAARTSRSRASTAARSRSCWATAPGACTRCPDPVERAGPYVYPGTAALGDLDGDARPDLAHRQPAARGRPARDRPARHGRARAARRDLPARADAGARGAARHLRRPGRPLRHAAPAAAGRSASTPSSSSGGTCAAGGSAPGVASPRPERTSAASPAGARVRASTANTGGAAPRARVCAPSRRRRVRVRVAPRVRLRLAGGTGLAGSEFVLRGGVRPAHPGALVYLQRRAGRRLARRLAPGGPERGRRLPLHRAAVRRRVPRPPARPTRTTPRAARRPSARAPGRRAERQREPRSPAICSNASCPSSPGMVRTGGGPVGEPARGRAVAAVHREHEPGDGDEHGQQHEQLHAPWPTREPAAGTPRLRCADMSATCPSGPTSGEGRTMPRPHP